MCPATSISGVRLSAGRLYWWGRAWGCVDPRGAAEHRVPLILPSEADGPKIALALIVTSASSTLWPQLRLGSLRPNAPSKRRHVRPPVKGLRGSTGLLSPCVVPTKTADLDAAAQSDRGGDHGRMLVDRGTEVGLVTPQETASQFHPGRSRRRADRRWSARTGPEACPLGN